MTLSVWFCLIFCVYYKVIVTAMTTHCLYDWVVDTVIMTMSFSLSILQCPFKFPLKRWVKTAKCTTKWSVIKCCCCHHHLRRLCPILSWEYSSWLWNLYVWSVKLAVDGTVMWWVFDPRCRLVQACSCLG